MTYFSAPYHDRIMQGAFANITWWSKLGYNPAVATNEEDVWSAGGSYVFPPSAQQLEVISSSTNDAGTSIFDGTATGGSTTTLEDSAKDFTAGTPVAAGDCVLLDKAGASPEWGYVTGVAETTLTVAGGFSGGGSAAGRGYHVVDKSAATGAQAVLISYLNASYAQDTEIVILNGTTAVPTVQSDLFRINGFRVVAAGSGAVAAGNLSLRETDDSPVYSYITAGFTRARNSAYTVPAGKTLYVNEWNAGAATGNDSKVQTARLFLKFNREPDTGFVTQSIFYTGMELLVSNGVAVVQCQLPGAFPAQTDIKVSALGLTGFNGPITSFLRGYLIG